MPNELAELSDLLELVTSPQQLHQELKREVWSADLVKWLPPVEGTAPAVWFHKVAELIIQHGVQPHVIALLRPPRLGRAGDFDRYCAKWIAPGGDQGPSDDHAAAGQTDAVTPDASASPPPSPQAAHLKLVVPPGILRCSETSTANDNAEASQTDDTASRISASPPPSAQAALPTPVAPPAIPRRWLPPNAETPLNLSQLYARLVGRTSTGAPHPDALQTADLLQHQVLILLGESGAGKSFELNELRRMEATLGEPLRLHAGQYSDPNALRKDLLDQWRRPSVAERRTLYLDALDEDRTPGQRLGDALVDALGSMRQEDRANVWIRVTSRTASLPAELERQLSVCFETDATPKILVLQPLSEEEAALIAEEIYRRKGHRDATTLAKAVLSKAQRLDMLPFTTNPLTLNFLCAAHAENDEKVSRVDLYEAGISTLLEEPEPSDAPARRPLDLSDALDLAGWIAALSTLADWSPIPIKGSRRKLSIPKLAKILSTDSTVLHRVLLTPLFEDVPGAIYPARRFAHHSFAEWLTARWILTQGNTTADGGQLWRDRLTASGSCVPSRLAGVVSWLVCMDVRWMEHVISVDAAIVVTPSLPLESVERRLQVFQSLISAARSGALNDHYRRLTDQNATLTLNGAEREVSEAIDALVPNEAHTVGFLVCLVAMSTLIHLDAGRIERSGAKLIVDALVRLALAHDVRGYALAEEATSVLMHGLTVSPERFALPRTMESRWWDAHVFPLRELLIDPKTRPDLPADEEAARATRLAYTLELLFPRVITSTDLVASLHQPRGHIVGHYNIFLRHGLPLLAKDEPALIPPLLRWWTQQPSHAIRSNVDGDEVSAWTVAWERRTDPVIWAVLVETFYSLLKKYSAPEHLAMNRDERHRLLLALWNHHHAQPDYRDPLYSLIGTRDAHVTPEDRLLHHEDIQWWVDVAATGTDRMRDEIFGTICSTIWRDNREAHLELLRAVRAHHGSARQALESRLQTILTRAELHERGEPLPEIPEIRNEALDAQDRQWAREAEERRTSMMAALQPSEPPRQAWWTIACGLMHHSHHAGAVPENQFWTTITEPEKAQVMDRAREYLEAPYAAHPDNVAVLHNQWSHGNHFAVAAILVLAKFSPSEDLGLSRRAWERWALTVVAEHVPSPVLDQLGPARARVDPLPNTALRRVFKELETTTNKKAAEHLASLAQHGEPHALADELRQTLARGLSEEAEAVMLERCASRNDPAGEVARETARARLRAGREPNEGRWRRAGLALWLSQHITEADKELLLVWLNDEESLRLLKEHNYWALALDPLNQLSPGQLVRLYKQTHRLFPPPRPAPEPTVGEGSGVLLGSLGDQSPSSLLNDILYTLKKQTSSEAADALEELGRDNNNAELIQRAVLMRRELQRANWQPPSIEDLWSFAVGAKPHNV